ncbi:hypothetical protein [Undibacterium sp. Xuan67W]|uniref:hypothetical protein n=1 Tax=Undibacterium sp. Xuan67W TaxID=3413057 RepID=UPI003BF4112A
MARIIPFYSASKTKKAKQMPYPNRKYLTHQRWNKHAKHHQKKSPNIYQTVINVKKPGKPGFFYD